MKIIRKKYDHQGYPWAYIRDYNQKTTIVSSHDTVYVHCHDVDFVNMYKVRGDDLIRLGHTTRKELSFIINQLRRYAKMLSSVIS